MGNTLKTSTTARFGSRYGVGVKKRVLKVENKQKEKVACINCGFKKIKRKSRGIFYCKKCGHTFAGGAFLPQTLSGGIIKKMVVQKSFLPLTKELLEATETKEEVVAEEEPAHEKGRKKPKEE